ncbi:MAG: alpha/beta hydrolase [Phormidesmis sp.]
MGRRVGQTVGQIVVWLAAGVTFFLSLWIVLPGPTLFFLRLAVGAPENSPLLALIALLLLGLTLRLYGSFSRKQTLPPLLLLILLATLALSSLPLLQQPEAVAQAQRSMALAFEAPSLDAASYPTFSWLNFFRGVPLGAVRSRKHIEFGAPANQPLFLDLYQPSTPGQYPAVVTIYGGSWQQGSPAASAQMSQYLAARGYVVVAIDYRHAPQYPFPAQLEDVQSALAFISDRADDYEIDRDRVALLGWSAGAHLAMLAGFQPGRSPMPARIPARMPARMPVKSIVDYYGPIDLAAGYVDPPVPDPINSRKVLLALIGGPPSDRAEAYAAASPITYVKTAEANQLPPVLLIYGGRDHLVEARFGKRMYDALIQSGNQAVWIKIPWAEHAFDKIFNGVSNQMALHFIEQFLHQTLL